jgi:hypothetical protein
MSREFLFMDTSPEPTDDAEEAVTDTQEPASAPASNRWRTIIDSGLVIEPGGDISDTPVPQRQADTY